MANQRLLDEAAENEGKKTNITEEYFFKPLDFANTSGGPY